MLRSKFKIEHLILAFTGVAIFALSIHPITTYDTFFGLKIGEWVITHHAIPAHEVFSWAAQGRTIVAYEWLAQTIVYLINQAGGFQAIEIYTATMMTVFFLINFSLFKLVLKRDFASSLIFSMFLCASTYEFFVARPQIIAYTALSVLIFLILDYILNNKNRLFLALPLTYIWTNSHASFIFIPFLLFSYACLSYIYHRTDKKRAANTFKNLTLFGLLSLIVTILPPLFLGPYKLLLDFFSDIKFMTVFLTEWAPLSAEPAYLLLYFILLILTLPAILIAVKRRQNSWLLAIPLFIILLYSFQAIRHIPFALISATIIICTTTPNFSFKKRSMKTLLSCAIFFILLTVSGWFIFQKRDFLIQSDTKTSYEIVNFLKSHHLNGHMYNDVALGGYYIYYLYPEYQVFFDGRADIYHCCEMRSFWNLTQAKSDSIDDFRARMNTFLNKYNFSFVIVSVESNNPLQLNTMERIADTMRDNPAWRLIYFSDHFRILVKKNGKNTKTFKDLGVTAATPYLLSAFKRGQEKQAIEEYKDMIKVQDSSTAETGLGEAYLSLGDLNSAQLSFKKAIDLNPSLGRAYLGLGKISQEQGDIETANNYFTKAIRTSDFLAEAYVLLGQNYANEGRKDEANQVWQEALGKNIDFISRQKIIQLLDRMSQ